MELLSDMNMQFLKDLLVIATSLIAIYNIDSWRREHKGKRNIELAEETLALFYEARDIIRIIRSPLGFEHETESIKKQENETETEFKARKQASVVFVRYDQNKTLFNKLHAYRYRFMAQIGKEKAKPFDELDKIVNEIFKSAYALGILWSNNYFPTDEQRIQNDKEIKKYRAIFWDTFSETDPINPKLDKVITDIEETCRNVIIGKPSPFSFLKTLPEKE